MMKKMAVGVALAVWGSSVAAQMVGVGRVGALAGVYDFDFEFSAGGLSANESSSELSVGLLTGYTVAWETFFADLALEYQTVDGDDTADFDRTDILLSVGAFLPADFSASIGYRFGYQGDGAFDDDFYNETGPFVGIGFPSFGVGGDWTVSTSAAVNFTELEFPNNATADFFGISGRAAISKPGMPHSFGLRLQQFSDDEDGFDLTETYGHLFYQYNFLAMGG